MVGQGGGERLVARALLGAHALGEDLDAGRSASVTAPANSSS